MILRPWRRRPGGARPDEVISPPLHCRPNLIRRLRAATSPQGEGRGRSAGSLHRNGMLETQRRINFLKQIKKAPHCRGASKTGRSPGGVMPSPGRKGYRGRMPLRRPALHALNPLSPQGRTAALHRRCFRYLRGQGCAMRAHSSLPAKTGSSSRPYRSRSAHPMPEDASPG